MKRWRCMIGRGIAFLLVVLPLLCACSAQASAEASLILLDVGQGSALLIRSPEGDILVDAGSESSEERLLLRLRELGVSSLKLVVFTHGDEDHIGGGDAVLREIPTETVWHNGVPSESESYRRLEEEWSRRADPPVVAEVGMGYDLGPWHLTVYHADRSLRDNEASLVLRLVSGSFRALLMGDATKSVEAELLERFDASQLCSDVLYLGHHGAQDVGSEDFLTAVAPRVVPISCGRGNPYGFPDGRTLGRVEKTGAEILRTDLLGEIRIDVTDGAWSVWRSEINEKRG